MMGHLLRTNQLNNMTSDEKDVYVERLIRRRAELLERIERACAEVDRDPATVEIVAVSKTVGVDEVEAALEAGYSIFGENRPQELVAKVDELAERGLRPRFDLIGTLQTNKINSILGRTHTVHSISSERTARAVSTRAERDGLVQECLLQVNVSGEGSKDGMTPAEVLEAAPRIAELPGLSIAGAMTMAPQGDPAEAERTFAGLAELLDSLDEAHPGLLVRGELSMGMSEDFESAIRHGATMVRLGRIVFDPDFSVY